MEQTSNNITQSQGFTDKPTTSGTNLTSNTKTDQSSQAFPLSDNDLTELDDDDFSKENSTTYDPYVEEEKDNFITRLINHICNEDLLWTNIIAIILILTSICGLIFFTKICGFIGIRETSVPKFFLIILLATLCILSSITLVGPLFGIDTFFGINCLHVICPLFMVIVIVCLSFRVNYNIKYNKVSPHDV